MEDLPERRKNGGFTEDQFTILKARLKDELRKELTEEFWNDIKLRIGDTVLKKGAYLFGATCLAALAWLHGAGYLKNIKIPGATE